MSRHAPSYAATSGRWTPTRKLDLLVDIAAGEITRAGAFERFGVTEAELDSWERRWAAYGARGLSVTKMQRFRA